MHEPRWNADDDTMDDRTIELRVKNHPGVMVHVASLFARRAFNLDGILCGPLADAGQSRMFLRVGAETRLDQVIHQLEKLHDVVEVRRRPDLGAQVFDLQHLVGPG